jgi:hypothetical protein
MDKFKFKEGVILTSAGVISDLMEGYIVPSDVMVNKVQAEIVERAIETLKAFERSAEREGVLELY